MGKLIIGSGITVDQGVTNLTVINSPGEYDSSHESKVIINQTEVINESGVIVAPVSQPYSTLKTSSFVTVERKFYPCDATGGEINVTLNPTLNEYAFVKVDGTANSVVITPTSGAINGDSSYSLTSQNQAVQVFFDGTNYYAF